MMDADQFEVLFPLALDWVKQQEQLILQKGIRLCESQIEDARQVGVLCPEKIRILGVDTIPFPSHPELQKAAVQIGVLSHSENSVTFGNGICIRNQFFKNRYLLIYEMVMIRRQEELGGLGPFLREYLTQCLQRGSNNTPMDTEAYKIAEQICSPKTF